MKCFADFGDIAYSKHAVESRVVCAVVTRFDQAGDAGCNENYDVVDGPNERAES